ncbi:MAG TPA: sugar phosphate isomerase/epimerase family protein [Rubrobacteraceae bacterium]|nr:sugar phosphate isomerase/epimerase family protein [Rubrobacteraceae bacterium]
MEVPGERVPGLTPDLFGALKVDEQEGERIAGPPVGFWKDSWIRLKKNRGALSRALPPFEVSRTREEDRRVLLDALEELGEHADREGTLVLLEPLNRYEDHMLNRLEEAVELSRASGRVSVKVMGDLFHMNIEEDDATESIRRAEGHLAHVHLADSNRAHPGAGHNDFASTFAALRDIGFDGYLAMECSIRGDAEKVLPQVVRHLRSLME